MADWFSFSDARVGWGLLDAPDGNLGVTTDGGKTWAVAQGRITGVPRSGIGALPLHAGEVDNPQQVLAIGPTVYFAYNGPDVLPDPSRKNHRSGVLVSRDRGSTWVRCLALPAADARIVGLAASDARHLWALCESGFDPTTIPRFLLRSTDGGRTWREVWRGRQGKDFRGLYLEMPLVFLDAQHAWAHSASGGIWRTSDGGATWNAAGSPDGGSSMAAIDSLHAWAAFGDDNGEIPSRGGGLFLTNDGGRSWQTIKRFSGEPLFSIYFSDAQHGWVEAENGIYATSDGGRSWSLELAEGFPNWSTWTFTRAGNRLVAGNGSVMFWRSLPKPRP